MKYLGKNEAACIECHQCEEACSKAYFKEVDADKSCIRINVEMEADQDWLINVCNQCGECIEVCSEKAISRNKFGVVMIDKKKCVGCLMCVGFCPSLSMRTHEEQIEPFKCIACGICTKQCPTNAIFITEDLEQVAVTQE